MKARCDNPSHTSFKNYGARGVGYEPTWAVFENFLKDMGERPTGKSLDRIDNAKGYSKGNCRWASRQQQNRNKRSNVMVTYMGQTKCLSQWCEELGLPYPRTYNRLVTRGLDPESAFRR